MSEYQPSISAGATSDAARAARWLDRVPVLDRFAQVADSRYYAPLPDDWSIGISDVVGSTAAIAAGRYKAVNLAGAGTVSAVANALGGTLPVFAFGGDGAHFAVPPHQAAVAADALGRVAAWAARDLGLDLRVAMVGADAVRAATRQADVRVAFWQASADVRYAMFTGGGIAWAETQLKNGHLPRLAGHGDGRREPDLTGLSCQWGTIPTRRGSIVSLIVKPAPGAAPAAYAAAMAEVVAALEEPSAGNPVPADGPDVRWPAATMALQARVADRARTTWRRRLNVAVTATMAWAIFKLGRPIGRFDPAKYRREIAANTDFRKFSDGLMVTVDCSAATIVRLRHALGRARADGVVRYGMHVQDEALMTCVVPSVFGADHMHFVDGAGGGYALAAQELRGN